MDINPSPCHCEERSDEAIPLKKRIAELEAERRWIPVSEKNPPRPYAMYLTILHSPYEGLQDVVYIVRYSDRWIVPENTANLVVTHWMELPKLPEVS